MRIYRFVKLSLKKKKLLWINKRTVLTILESWTKSRQTASHAIWNIIEYFVQAEVRISDDRSPLLVLFFLLLFQSITLKHQIINHEYSLSKPRQTSQPDRVSLLYLFYFVVYLEHCCFAFMIRLRIHVKCAKTLIVIIPVLWAYIHPPTRDGGSPFVPASREARMGHLLPRGSFGARHTRIQLTSRFPKTTKNK